MDKKDKKLLEIYMNGYSDEIMKKGDRYYWNSLKKVAYLTGRIDAQMEDGIDYIANQTDMEIINKIRKN